MAFPRWKTSPDFVLASNRKGSQDGRHDPKAQRERMNMFKRQLAANRTKGSEEVMKRNRAIIEQRATQDQPTSSFVTRSMVEALRDERLAEEGEVEEKDEPDDPDAVQISAEDWPFVYFVVALDQMPAASEGMKEYKVSKTHTAKERQRIQAARKRRLQQSREAMERVRESGIDTGLRLEPLSRPGWSMDGAASQCTSSSQRRPVFHSRHLNTPISLTSSREPVSNRGNVLLNRVEQLAIEDMVCRGFSQWFSDNFATGSGNSQPASLLGKEAWEASSTSQPQNNGNRPSSLHLPDILSDQIQRKVNNLLSCNSAPTSLIPSPSNNYKKVHFTEGLPFIKGNSIVMLQKNSEADPRTNAPGIVTTSSCSVKTAPEEVEQGFNPQLAPWSAPLTSRSTASLAPRSKMFKPLPMPKIDIVSEIYDELIIKTIQSFLEREGYSADRFENLRTNIMARLSATYPHLARHRAWKLVRKDAADGEGVMAETDERNRMKLRPLHQGFFAATSVSEVANFAKENDAMMNHIPHGCRDPSDPIRPRWVPVLPTHSRPMSLTEEERYTNTMFMSVDGRHISFTPRDDIRFKTPTLPGATSDYRMAPLIIHDDNKPVKTWTHIIPSGVRE